MSSLVSARLLMAGVLVVVLAAVGLFALPQPDGAVLATYGLTLLAVGASTRWVYLGLQKPGIVAAARVLGEAIMAVLVVALVRGAGDVGTVPLAQFAGDALCALLLLAVLRRRGVRLAVAVDWPLVRASLGDAWPLVLRSLLGLVIFNCDFIFLRVFRDARTVGWYAAAYTLVSFLLNLGISYEQSLLPALARLSGSVEHQREQYDGAMAQVFAGGIAVVLGGVVVAPGIVGLVFGPAYAPSAIALQVLLWSVPVALFRNVAQTGLIAKNRQDQVLRTSAWSAGANVALNALVIPVFGMVGAAAVTLATETFRTLLTLVYAARAGFPMTSPRRFWRSALAGLAMVAVLRTAGVASVWLEVAVGALIYVAALAALGAIRRRADGLPGLRL